MSILLIIKARTFREAKDAAQQRGVPISAIANQEGIPNAFRAVTYEDHILAVQRWWKEPDEFMEGNQGYVPGTLLLFKAN